jgi:hypothetical protein
MLLPATRTMAGRARVCLIGANETKRGEIEGVHAIYMVPGVRWRSATSAATAGRGAGDAVASFCASSRRDEDDDVLFVFIHAKGYVGWFGLRLGPGCWAAVQAATGLVRAVLVGCSMGCPTR